MLPCNREYALLAVIICAFVKPSQAAQLIGTGWNSGFQNHKAKMSHNSCSVGDGLELLSMTYCTCENQTKLCQLGAWKMQRNEVNRGGRTRQFCSCPQLSVGHSVLVTDCVWLHNRVEIYCVGKWRFIQSHIEQTVNN